jgi:hypothetical protein
LALLPGLPAEPTAGLATVAGLGPVFAVLRGLFARVRATPLRAEGFLSVPERTAAEFKAAELGAAEFEAAARWDEGSAAATDGLSEQSVFGRGAEIGSPSASPPLDQYRQSRRPAGFRRCAIQGARGRCHVPVYDSPL